MQCPSSERYRDSSMAEHWAVIPDTMGFSCECELLTSTLAHNKTNLIMKQSIDIVVLYAKQ